MIGLAVTTVRVAALATVLGGCVALGSARGASAAADVKIASVDCESDPQVVELTNSGDTSQDLTGWKLQSDPLVDESYDLTPIRILAPGSSVFIESGPNAEATFTWSTEVILRAGDSNDFARLVDDQGATRSEEACAGAQTTATPAPTPTPAPTATAAPADGVPDGGGPPTGQTGTLLTPLTAIVAGASLAGAGSLALVAVWLGGTANLLKRREPVVYELPPPPPPPRSKTAPRGSGATSEPLILAIVVALCAAILVALVLPSSRHGK